MMIFSILFIRMMDWLHLLKLKRVSLNITKILKLGNRLTSKYLLLLLVQLLVLTLDNGMISPLTLNLESSIRNIRILDGKKKHTPKLTKPINPDLYLRKFLVCPICGHALTGSESKGNGGKYAYYHCCHDGKHLRKRADEVNEGFARYVSCLTPNEEVLSLYKEVLTDVRNEQGRETRNKVEDLQ